MRLGPAAKLLGGVVLGDALPVPAADQVFKRSERGGDVARSRVIPARGLQKATIVVASASEMATSTILTERFMVELASLNLVRVLPGLWPLP